MGIAAVGQICSTASMSHNLSQCRLLVQKAVAAGAKALFLPEASDYIASNASEGLSIVQPAHKSPFVRGLQSSARENELPIQVGIHEPSKDGKKVKNTLVWIDEKGEIKHRYQKLHLFDIEIPGGLVMKESDSVEPGREIGPPFRTALGNIGMQICFDLRFAEPSLSLRRQGVHILTYPSAFAVTTGRAHWSTLLCARAIETQSYVIAAAQAGAHNQKRTSYGHSMIISPWGEVLAELGGEPEEQPRIVVAEIDLNKVAKIREEMPLSRRTDVYPEV